MFVDEPHLKTVRAWLEPQVRMSCNRITNGIETHRSHPTFITRTALKNSVVELKYAMQLLMEAGGYAPGMISEELQKRYDETLEAANLYGLTR